MDKFAERLKELRIENNMSLKELATEIGSTSTSISRWENKLRIPNIESLIALAKYFKVTADYLLGLEN